MKQEGPLSPSDRTYAYLNIDDPVCAWATYRGVLSSPPTDKGFLSVWHAGVLKGGGVNRLKIELKMEEVRAKHFPQLTSRLRGMFCFHDTRSVRLASESWGNHFSLHNFSEIEVSKARNDYGIHDANWFTWANRNPSDSLSTDEWIADYWSGRPHVQEEPIWETIIDGEFIVINSRLRQVSYSRIRNEFPDSVAFLEIASIGAYLQSNIGSIHGFLMVEKENRASITYCMDMRDASNPKFLETLRWFMESDAPVNRRDLAPYFSRDTLGHTPDLRPYGHSWVLTG